MEGGKILLVDDSDVVAGMLTRFLETLGYLVIRAADGVAGVRMAYAEAPDLIIMDVEMPLLQGYQASRLLKSRRGVRDIPIIMHTSRAEDRDRHWAHDAGVDAFIPKDFDNLDALAETIRRLLAQPRPDAAVIREDARFVNGDAIFEMIGQLYDRLLFQSTIVNLLGETGGAIASVRGTVDGALDVLSRVCEYNVAVLMMSENRRPLAYIRPNEGVVESDVTDFLGVCLNDFFPHFPHMDPESTQRAYLGIDHRTDFRQMRLDTRRISSYALFEIRGKGGAVVGTLHLGSFTNNYFTDTIKEDVRMFCGFAGTILENAIMYNRIFAMETRIRDVFARFVPREIIDELLEKSSEAAYLSGEKRRVAVLFADIRSFTTISEQNSPEDVVAFLNYYFNIMVGVIREHGGTIDKFLGDAILAIFGAPKSYEDNARRAVRAAIDMIRALPRVDLGRLALPEGGFSIGIGINEGPAVVGNIGCSDKFDYTVIGDTVNLAARLEGLTKYYHQSIVVSGAVAEQVGEGAFFRLLDTVRVKGKDQSSAIYSAEPDENAFDADFMDRYEKGLKLYRMGNFETALGYFDACLERMPGEPVCVLYVERCRKLMASPPEAWDGATVFDFK